MSQHQEAVYFAADKADKTVAYVTQKATYWFDSLINNDYLDKIKRSWLAYHGVYYEDSHSIGFGGEQGELVNFAVNHYRNIAQHMLVMVTSNRPAFQPRSINTDSKSQIQVTLAHGLLEYYMREKRLERHLKLAVEYAIVLGSGYIKMEWNSTSGEIYDYIGGEVKEAVEGEESDLDSEFSAAEEKGFPVYEGDIQFTNLSPYDVVFDTTKETSEQHDWVLCRSFKNKYDLIAKYPELKDEILMARTKSELHRHRISLTPLDDTLDVPVYEFFHKRTEALPQGRYVMYLDEEIILQDTPMPYRRLPVYRISPSDILGTPFGYTTMWDLIPIQDSVNSLYSTILTNQNAFGVQNILNPRGNDIKVNQLEGGLNFIEYNAQAGDPKPLNLTSTPPEIFNFVGMLEKNMETISAVNAVARGTPEASLRSGNALALVQSQALQFMNGLQQNYIQLIEDVGTGIIELLQDFAEVPRIAEIAGLSNSSKMREFKGDDLDSISRVIVDVGNALSQTTAGRAEMAQNLLQMGLITTPEQYFSVLNTGKIETMTEGITNELILIKGENERLVDGTTEVLAVDTDNHALHIKEHKNVLGDPDARLDPELLERTLLHIQEHIDALATVDPNLLMITGQQPLQPQGQQPQGQPPAGGPMPPGSEQLQGPDIELPQPAEPAQSPDGAPVLASDVPLAR